MDIFRYSSKTDYRHRYCFYLFVIPIKQNQCSLVTWGNGCIIIWEIDVQNWQQETVSWKQKRKNRRGVCLCITVIPVVALSHPRIFSGILFCRSKSKKPCASLYRKARNCANKQTPIMSRRGSFLTLLTMPFYWFLILAIPVSSLLTMDKKPSEYDIAL